MNDPQQTILIIEDEVDIAEIVLEYLQREGYHSIHVLSGIEAIKILNMQSVDLLLLDVNLPGMSRFDLCREILTEGGLNMKKRNLRFQLLWPPPELRKSID